MECLEPTIFKVFLNVLTNPLQLPECDSDEDEDFKQQVADLRTSMPFAVVGSSTMVEVGC